MMKVLAIGAGCTGAHIIRQLRKNLDIEIITADPRTDSYAVDTGVIEAVDIHEGDRRFCSRKG